MLDHNQFFTKFDAAQCGASSRPTHCANRSPSLTGGESLKAKVDWMTATWEPAHLDFRPFELVTELLKDAFGGVLCESVNGMFGYESGLRFYVPYEGKALHVGRFDFGGTHHGGRVRLDISGAGCSRVKDWPFLQFFIEKQINCKLTRVDLAVDMLNGEYTVEDAVNWYQAGDFNAGGRNPRHSLVGDWLDPRHGRTLEIGRRENGKMLRCYEKGRQLGDQSSNWTRFEVEIRNNDRDIPFEILTQCDQYFTGAYRCLENILHAAAHRIATHQKEGEISLSNLTHYAREAYGQLVHVLRAQLDPAQIIEILSREGVPKRLERTALTGLTVGMPLIPFSGVLDHANYH